MRCGTGARRLGHDLRRCSGETQRFWGTPAPPLSRRDRPAACRVPRVVPPKPAALNRRTRAMDGSGGAVDRYSVGSGNFSDVLSRIRDEDAVDESTDVIDLIRAKWINQRVKVRQRRAQPWRLTRPDRRHLGTHARRRRSPLSPARTLLAVLLAPITCRIVILAPPPQVTSPHRRC